MSESPDALAQQNAALEAALLLPLPEESRRNLMADIQALRKQQVSHPAMQGTAEVSGTLHGNAIGVNLGTVQTIFGAPAAAVGLSASDVSEEAIADQRELLNAIAARWRSISSSWQCSARPTPHQVSPAASTRPAREFGAPRHRCPLQRIDGHKQVCQDHLIISWPARLKPTPTSKPLGSKVGSTQVGHRAGVEIALLPSGFLASSPQGFVSITEGFSPAG
jgi:hypothetical protein